MKKFKSLLLLSMLALSLFASGMSTFADDTSSTNSAVTTSLATQSTNTLVQTILDYANGNCISFVDAATKLGYYTNDMVLVDPTEQTLDNAIAVGDYIHNETGLPVNIQAVKSEDEIEDFDLEGGVGTAHDYEGVVGIEGSTDTEEDVIATRTSITIGKSFKVKFSGKTYLSRVDAEKHSHKVEIQPNGSKAFKWILDTSKVTHTSSDADIIKNFSSKGQKYLKKNPDTIKLLRQGLKYIGR
ncbi:hypothetical protein EQG49_00445 [Periweissella cryptocerci]|uniref:Uncharacterized protein n=1 Tax=Periweissella cryptocerci TaxID=2506420 RepID=A0A4P6YR05_9LACO|nr:hypothetical protein [Periweissella cryptocerci]QBO35023.1 hypothetical protein EQG49_00445 [Periweissella cryptocerci]